MIGNALKLSSVRNLVVNNRQINSRIIGVTYFYHRQKRNAHGSVAYKLTIANPSFGQHCNKILNTSVQYHNLTSFQSPLYYFNFQQHRFINSKIPEDCKPKKKSRSGLYLGGTVLLISGVLGYAKYDPEFRKTLDEYVKGTDDLIKFLFQEDKSYLEHISETLDKIKDRIVEIINNAFGSSPGEKDVKSGSSSKPLPPCDEDKKPYKPPRSAFKPLLEESGKKEDVKFTERRSIVPPEPPEKEPTITQDAVEHPRKTEGITENVQQVNPETHTQTLVELEDKIGNHAQMAIKNYNDAICALRDHAEDIYKLVESSVEKVDPQIWPQIKTKTEAKESVVNEAQKNAKDAENNIDKLKQAIDNPKLQAPGEVKDRAKKNMQKVLADVAEAKQAFEKEKDKVSVTEKYWNKVQEAREHFSEELQILFPNIVLNDKQLTLAEGEIDLFILYAFKNILFYQKEVNKLETTGEMRIKQAIEQSKKCDPDLIKSAVEAEIEKEKRVIQEAFQKKTLEIKAECEKDIRNQLKRQAQAHNDHLNEVVALKEKEVERRLQRKVEDKILEIQTQFKEELTALVARLKGLDEAIKKRADQDKYAQQSQVLWSACQTLLFSLSNSDVTKPYRDQLKPLKDEVNAILKAGEKDDLVTVIIDSIPEEALERGIYSQDALRERFCKVEATAMQLDLVPEHGSSLFLILFSCIQSFLIIKNPLPIPAFELANEPFDPANLSTCDILQRARFWIDRGDIAQTLKYMNLLQGGARAVAKDWIKEARLLLETQQAANCLLVHASASGLVSS